MKLNVIHFWLTVIDRMIKDTFINDDKLCANMDIPMNSFTLYLQDTLTTTENCFQHRTVLHCAIMDVPEH